MFLNLSSYNKSKPRRKSKAKKPVQVYEKYTPRKFQPYVPTPAPFHRDTPDYPSLNTTGSINTARPERKEYTGTLVKGIATMHKSNAVPVIDEEQMRDISRMRRG